MRFFILSDLHLEKAFDGSAANQILNRLCIEIRKTTNLNTPVLFIFLGDIAHKGSDFSFEYAQNCLEYIKSELREYNVNFEFVPGNHDLQGDNLSAFDNVVKVYGNQNSFETKSTYSNEYRGINFIFTDSNLSRNHRAAGKLDIESIKAEIKRNKRNILFCHHALSHSHGDTHDTIKDSAAVIKQLNELGIEFFFHGHVHQSDVTIPEKGMIEIGSGCLSGDLSYAKGNIQHQFTVGYIRDNDIIRIERWVDNTDGNEIFASNQLFPEPKTFADPSTIDKISYGPINNYISRSVLPYESATGDTLSRLLSEEKGESLKDLLNKNSRILLLCDAGMGKSIELLNLAYGICDKYHTFFYSLKDYINEEIINILPETYRNLSSNRIALLLDGYDELSNSSREVFEKMLRRYLKENENAHIVISSRSNFCKPETSNKSKTFPNFNIYVLNKLDTNCINSVLDEKGINETQFWSEASAKKVNELLCNPFYLTNLTELYLNRNALPNKSELMDKLIERGFELDEDKYPGNLNDQYNKLFKSLEVIAFSMQLMHKYTLDDRSEYQELFQTEICTLVKQSGLFKREENGWSFSHNNFREYLAAKQLSKFQKDEAIAIFASGTNIKPSWVNTLGYLVNFNLSWDLQGWLSTNCPSALVKFESDKLDKHQRTETFKQIFTQYEINRLHLYDDFCDALDLAHFANSNEVLSFLLEHIQNPRHVTSQYTALNILRHFPSLFGKQAAIRETLLNCCKSYPQTDKMICRLAMLALCQQNLNNADVTSQLFDIFGESEEDYIRLGMYEYLIYSKELDNYSKYFLDGINYIDFRLDNNRIGNESFELVKGLKMMSTPKSIANILVWFSNEDINFHGSDKVLDHAVNTAIRLYHKGNTELYDVVLECYLSATKGYHNNIEQAFVKFFKETNTLFNTAILAAEYFEEKPHHIYYLLSSDDTIINTLKGAYEKDQLSHTTFQNIVIWYIRDEKTYKEYAELIRKIDKIDIPEYQAPVNYELLKNQTEQDYFDALLDSKKREKLIEELLSSIADKTATNDKILDLGHHIEFNSPLGRLKTAVYHYCRGVQISEFFNIIDLDDFIIWSASKYLRKQSLISPTLEQKSVLSNLISKNLNENTFQDPIEYYENGFSIKHKVPHFLALIIYLDIPISKEILLQFSELPQELFKEKTITDKYTYLQSKLSASELNARLIENVNSGRVKNMILQEHIDYFDSLKDDAITEYALKICKEDNEYLRLSAWKYLYHLFGAEYIESEILPFADGNFLIEINYHCKDINKEKMRIFMERQYENSPTTHLQAQLITLGSKTALTDYVNEVKASKKISNGRDTYMENPTRAIGSVCNPDYLLLLKELLIVALDKDFEDSDWNSLRSSLLSAFANCSKNQPQAVIEMVVSCRPDADSDENNFIYCNRIISNIQSANKLQQDNPLPLSGVKQILEKYQLLSFC